jgi:hypothetical protein
VTREELLEHIHDKLMEVATGEHEATRTLATILDEIESDFSWGAIQAGLNEDEEADWVVVMLFDLIHDDRLAVDRLMTAFTAWEKEMGLK